VRCNYFAIAVNRKSVTVANGLSCRTAAPAEQFPVVAKKYSQPFGDGKHPLPVRYGCEYFLVQLMPWKLRPFPATGEAGVASPA